MEYKHIDDCWNALRETKTWEEAEQLFDTFPIWSGSWMIYTNESGSYTIENDYRDSNGDLQTDREDFDFEEEE